VALKAIQLSAFGESAGELEKCLLAEAETTKVLSNPNLTPVFGAGEIEGQFYAAMEYIQGNSVATMLARKRRVLHLGSARYRKASLQRASITLTPTTFFTTASSPPKLCAAGMAQSEFWIGVSSVGKFTAQMPGVPFILHTLSPEQVRGENIDARSNIYSLGALFYEMVTDHKAFDSEDSEILAPKHSRLALPSAVAS